jgi:hypothetical protein
LEAISIILEDFPLGSNKGAPTLLVANWDAVQFGEHTCNIAGDISIIDSLIIVS